MKKQIKKITYNILKIIWAIIGILILFWSLFWYIKIYTIGEIGGVLAGTILLASGLYAFLIYTIITLLFLLIKWIIKKIAK